MSVDLESLKALDMVISEGSFAKAAERLHKAQSAVSYQIRKLEQALNLELLDRASYRAQLTPAGEAVLAEGRKLLANAGQLEALAHSFASGWEPSLMVIIDGILPLNPILLALKQMADARVPTRIQVKVEFLYGVQYRFEKDQADIMLVKDYEPHPLLKSEDLPTIECILCVAKDHPLAKQVDISLSELQSHIELSVQDSSDRGDDRHMFGGERVFRLSGFIAKKDALLMGLGFGWMPKFLIEDELASGELVEVKYREGSRYEFTPRLVSRVDRATGKASQKLTEALKQHIAARHGHSVS
ncbi:LysR family transcriptional regulator [Permianibacter aggregans]|uniref:DNA-binding transcriptional LysR family regulator n=1 Tax=Permianibacter aggregans TaxID=1510150 RepID=A0A4R6URW6_9GAMM|nr:LysR family transcriptional regulator [Permianibacter aggregans]QGX39452.1 LysR family transcriptional regulator [Permianibacter aggregans]TDQ49811.1 DNA-binding transcriptional LysR family regulator [Permianibacter aggregans]